MNGYDKLEIDSPPETYSALSKWAKTLRGIPGMSCEVGLRRGGGTVTICDAFVENDDRRIHIALDPFGNIIYHDKMGPHRSDYTNSMRNETLPDLYRYAADKGINIIFFNLEDSEFYLRFPDGVPIYDQEKRYENQYCFVHVDGQHDSESVAKAAKYFVARIARGGIIAFDNVDHYDHSAIHDFLIQRGYVVLEETYGRRFYRNN